MSDDFLAGRRILCVEDETLVAMLIEDILQELGCETIGPFAKASVALEALGSVQIDGALLDVNLRGQDSYSIADALQRMGCPFLFLTGYGEEGVKPAYRNAPILQKPFNAGRVGAALRELIRSAGEDRQRAVR